MFRFVILALGIGFILLFAAVLIIVLLNLPYSWPGLLIALLGFWGAISCFRYFKNQRRILFIPIVATVLVIAVYFGMTFITGD